MSTRHITSTPESGIAGTTARGALLYTSFSAGNTWLPGNTWSIYVTTTTGNFLFGAGPLTGVSFRWAFTFDNRIHVLSDKTWFGSSLFDPMQWNVQSPSAFNIQLANSYGGYGNYCCMTSYQGRLAIFGPNNIQIWTLDPDPDLIRKNQDFYNIGTAYPLSVQQLGNLDAIFLHSSGVKSLKVRESTLNASTIDVGTPIDSLVQTSYNVVGGTQPCSVVDPETGTYWLTRQDWPIYVFSYYPMAEISAWSTFEKTYFDGGGEAPFNAEKMLVHNGEICCLGTDVDDNRCLFFYRGDQGTVLMQVETTKMALRTPTVAKRIGAFNAVYGATFDPGVARPNYWKFYIGVNPNEDQMQLVLDTATMGTNGNDASRSAFDIGRVPVSLYGTHVKLRVETNEPYAELSALYLELNNEGTNLYA